MNNHIDNNKDIEWNNNEKKNSNWFKKRWESMKHFFEQKENDTIKDYNKKSEWLKDLVVDSSLLDMEKGSELSDSKTETKEELTKIFDRRQKDPKDVLNHKELFRQISQHTKRLQWRPTKVAHEIENLAMNVENDINNYEEEGNPIAKSFLKIAKWIMDTENKA